MAKRKIRKAKPPKKFFSMRDIRLTGTKGHTALLKANKPKLLPEVLWLEAARKGCIEFDAELIKAAAEAAKEAVTEEEATSDPRGKVKRAVQQVLMLDDPQTVTKEGVPKVAVVKRVLADPDIQVSSELVYELYFELTETLEEDSDEVSLEELERRVDRSGLEDPDGVLEEVGGGVAAVVAEAGGLEDEE